MKFSKLLSVSIAFATSTAAIAQNHGSLAAHVHGVASLVIGLEKNNKISIDVEMPGDSAVGFEHTAKSPVELAAKKRAEDTFKEKFAELVILPGEAKCTWGNPKVEVAGHKGHSDWDVQIVAVCQKSLEGETVAVAFGKHFPSLDRLNISIIGQDFQKKITLKKGSGSLSLTK